MEECRLISELPSKMAHLDIIGISESDVNNVTSESTSPRVLRKRKSFASETTKSSNRRVSMKPRKYYLPENANPKQIEALYLNKTINTRTQTLETIYEEPKPTDNDSYTFIGRRKKKRLLTFQIGSQYTKEKIKKRRAKIKKLLGHKSFINRNKIPMNVFLKTIECLELDEVIETENKPIVSVTL